MVDVPRTYLYQLLFFLDEVSHAVRIVLAEALSWWGAWRTEDGRMSVTADRSCSRKHRLGDRSLWARQRSL